MDIESLRDTLCGLSVTTATPFTSDLKHIDTSGLVGNLEYLSREGVKFLVPCGNTGEFYSLSEQEWREVFDATVSSVGSDVTIMPGVGHSVGTAIDQMEYAKNAGAQMVMVMYPQHVFRSEEGLLDYCTRILEAADGIGVVLYKKGPLLTDAVFSKILKYKHLIGAKYAFGRIADFARTVHSVGDSLAWSCGTAERFAPFFWLAGARGFTSGLGNFAPKVSLKMYDALQAGDYDEAMRIQRMIEPLEFIRERNEKSWNVPVIKSGLDHVGLVGGDCRPPIHTLTMADHDEIHSLISKWDL
ncbi:MAG: hypothetical protein DRP09_12385 [Candidatus Thorarchaeota archaeon]|nr:MAG: hypothetical protein DRP09_12385 [Candidatus Thorarchaeota archaeon]